MASLSGLRVQHCCKLRHMSQMWFGFGIAVAVVKASVVAVIGPLAWEIPHATGVALKRKKKKVGFILLRYKTTWVYSIYKAFFGHVF